MKSQHDQFITWLNSAYSMEQSLEKVLQNHAKDASDFPEIRDRIERHIAETRGHAERVRECLSLLDETPSTAKSVIGNITGMVQGASTGLFRDELIKNFLGDYASEHFEIACYRSLIAAAEDLEQPEIAELCRANLRDEEEMARWLEDSIPQVTRLVLAQQAVDA
ncbi:MAG TPA: ferritin-like domain-containing protein [Opitutus sp.]|nr:ferritin-like domain-containing protein [Opitutus sp.]